MLIVKKTIIYYQDSYSHALLSSSCDCGLIHTCFAICRINITRRAFCAENSSNYFFAMKLYYYRNAYCPRSDFIPSCKRTKWTFDSEAFCCQDKLSKHNATYILYYIIFSNVLRRVLSRTFAIIVTLTGYMWIFHSNSVHENKLFPKKITRIQSINEKPR